MIKTFKKQHFQLIIKLSRVQNLNHQLFKFCQKKPKTNVKGNSQISFQIPENNNEQKQLIESQLKDIQTMQKKYQQIDVTTFQGKSFSNLNALQKKIITQNKFNLSHPQIKPKLASLTSLPGIQLKQNITQISLGNIKIKQKNQVFLSEIDPYNIPQDYQIKFDEEKQLTLIGKRILKNKNQDLTSTDNQITSNSQKDQMQISQAQSFQQKSISQISQKYMGQIGYKYQFNRKRSFKEFLLVIPLIILLLDPIASTISQVYYCIKSIKQIQQEQMKQVTKIKKASMVNALLNNKDFNQLI